MPARFPFPADFFRMPLVDPQTGIITPEAALMLQTSLNADNLPDGSANQLTISNNLLAPSSPFNGDNEQWADTDSLPYGWAGAYLAGSKAVGRNNYRRSGSSDAFRGNYAQLLFCGANLTDIASRATRPEDVKEFLQYEFNGRAKVTLRPSAGNHGYRIEVDWFSSDASLVRGGSGFLSTSVIQSGAATPFAADNVYQSFNSTVTAPAGAKFARIVEASDATLRTVAQQIAIYSDTWTWKVQQFIIDYNQAHQNKNVQTVGFAGLTFIAGQFIQSTDFAVAGVLTTDQMTVSPQGNIAGTGWDQVQVTVSPPAAGTVKFTIVNPAGGALGPLPLQLFLVRFFR